MGTITFLYDVLKGVLKGVAIGLIMVAYIFWGGCQLLNSGSSSPEGTPQPDVKPAAVLGWHQYPVEGLLLCAPQDSTLAPGSCSVLPRGSVLLIPKIVPGLEVKKASNQLL